MPKRFNSLLMLFALGLLVGWIGGGASARDTSHANLQLPSRAIAIVDKAHRLIN